jgi:hypothetical protein
LSFTAPPPLRFKSSDFTGPPVVRFVYWKRTAGSVCQPAAGRSNVWSVGTPPAATIVSVAPALVGSPGSATALPAGTDPTTTIFRRSGSPFGSCTSSFDAPSGASAACATLAIPIKSHRSWRIGRVLPEPPPAGQGR